MSHTIQAFLSEYHAGSATRAYEFLGCQPVEGGFVFRLWAPHAQSVHVVGDFNFWNRRSHPMKSIGNGVWEIFLPGEDALWEGCRVKVIVDVVANHLGNISGWKNSMSDITPQVGEYWKADMMTDETYWHINSIQCWMSDGRLHLVLGTIGMPDLNTSDNFINLFSEKVYGFTVESFVFK